eukprot:CAMPEP_0179376780 /NCGR_PEP_ID=MMETSP0797-20121207/88492_1 /TAXON_ID=47934 /ORGANISM="Dinophysis acuminata, Strain DAEP01" /LENGTH=49 /DNA_ID= /DNA_START= /DNA_END= /DNA_ORIENTATION=
MRAELKRQSPKHARVHVSSDGKVRRRPSRVRGRGGDAGQCCADRGAPAA